MSQVATITCPNCGKVLKEAPFISTAEIRLQTHRAVSHHIERGDCNSPKST